MVVRVFFSHFFKGARSPGTDISSNSRHLALREDFPKMDLRGQSHGASGSMTPPSARAERGEVIHSIFSWQIRLHFAGSSIYPRTDRCQYPMQNPKHGCAPAQAVYNVSCDSSRSGPPSADPWQVANAGRSVMRIDQSVVDAPTKASHVPGLLKSISPLMVDGVKPGCGRVSSLPP